jgi:hypothetical protein
MGGRKVGRGRKGKEKSERSLMGVRARKRRSGAGGGTGLFSVRGNSVDKFGAFCLNLKWVKLLFINYYFLNKYKSEKYVKKLDEILRLLVKNFFQISIVCLVKI